MDRGRGSTLGKPGLWGGRVSEEQDQEQRAIVSTQVKLERFYNSTYGFLYGFKNWLSTLEDILVWNKPVASAVLYVVVHWLFVMASQNSVPLLCHVGNLVLLAIICDVLWRAAHNSFESAKATSEEDVVFFARKTEKKKKPEKPLSFEEAYMLSITQLEPKEMPRFEVVCLWLATAGMWLDNLFMALRDWSVNEPLVFFVCILTPGVFFSLLGKYVPTIVVVYILVMGLLVWPYIEYHDLRARAGTFLQGNYPRFVVLTQRYWRSFKNFLAKDTMEFIEVALSTKRNDLTIAQALNEAFEQFSHLKNERKYSTSSRSSSVGDSENTTPVEDKRPAPDPGMSVLQGSVLGMHPDAFKGGVEDSLGSLALPPGGFDAVDHSVGISRFPPQHQARDHTSSPQTLSTITEDDISLPTTSNSYNELDPFADSMELGHTWPDGGSGSGYHGTAGGGGGRAQQPTSTSTPSMLQQISEEPFEQASDFYSGGYQPPPSYEAAANGYDGAVSSSGISELSPPGEGEVSSTDGTEEKEDYMLRHRH